MIVAILPWTLYITRTVISKRKKMTNLYGDARFNGKSLRAEFSGNQKVVRAHCITCDNSGVYCYTNIDALVSDMSNDNHLYGTWEFSSNESSSAVSAFCPTCVSKKTNPNKGTK